MLSPAARQTHPRNQKRSYLLMIFGMLASIAGQSVELNPSESHPAFNARVWSFSSFNRRCGRRAARTGAVQAKRFKECLQGREGNHSASSDKFYFKLVLVDFFPLSFLF